MLLPRGGGGEMEARDVKRPLVIYGPPLVPAFWVGPISPTCSVGEKHLCLALLGALHMTKAGYGTRPSVGTAGFEPATSASRTLRAAKLRYVP